jgi:hypothetical protein
MQQPSERAEPDGEPMATTSSEGFCSSIKYEFNRQRTDAPCAMIAGQTPAIDIPGSNRSRASVRS